MGRSERPKARALWLGRRAYGPVHELQSELVRMRAAGKLSDTVLLLEHEPVVTLGRNADPAQLLAVPPVVPVVRTDRGGGATYHGPGQLVAYPLVDLAPRRGGLRAYVAQLGEAMVRIAHQHGVEAGSDDELVGVWADAAHPGRWFRRAAATRPVKIGAIGLRLARQVTTHGFALNVNVDLGCYRWIVPCGIRGCGVSSLAALAPPASRVELGAASAVGDTALGSAATLAAALDLDLAGVEDLSAVSDLRGALLGAAG
ncbi:MAG: lipoyl(octanoyl) transferase LipB [Deltaproteobacteria bacterium]|nr:lipoyl(octanoyl) transferase LipB [Deltaproteobacteria bacterium]